MRRPFNFFQSLCNYHENKKNLNFANRGHKTYFTPTFKIIVWTTQKLLSQLTSWSRQNLNKLQYLVKIFHNSSYILDTIQDFLINLGIKPRMHLREISICSINNVIIRLTKIMNRADKNWAHFQLVFYSNILHRIFFKL